LPIPDDLCWPVLRLVLEGHDYAKILTSWTMKMVLDVNRALDIRDQLRAMQQEQQALQAQNKRRAI